MVTIPQEEAGWATLKQFLHTGFSYSGVAPLLFLRPMILMTRPLLLHSVKEKKKDKRQGQKVAPLSN